MSDTPETDAVQSGPSAGSFFAMTDHARELERENAMLREKVKNQAARIRVLEGPINHAGGLHQ